jgi:hypothetical protein
VVEPLRYLWQPLLAVIEPFALDLWHHEITHWLPVAARAGLRKQSFFIRELGHRCGGNRQRD